MRCQACSKKSPCAACDPEQLRQLADDDRQRQSDDEALEHRLADEVGQEAQAQQAGDQGGRCRRSSASPAVSAAKRPSPRRDEVRDGGRRQSRPRRNRRHDEHPRAAQRGVQQRGRPAPRRGRRPATRRDARVRERLGNEDRPDREAGDQIAAQPPWLVGVQRREETRPGDPDATTISTGDAMTGHRGTHRSRSQCTARGHQIMCALASPAPGEVRGRGPVSAAACEFRHPVAH